MNIWPRQLGDTTLPELVAGALANGISPSQMYRLFIDDGIDAALKPEIFLRPAFPEFTRRACSIVTSSPRRTSWSPR